MKTLLDWRHQYDAARDKKEGDLAALQCLDESLTQQHFTNDADINVIAERFGLSGIPAFPLDPAAFRDTTADPDLRQILDQNIEARNYFNALPHKIRQRFHYSIGELWNFINDPENAEEAVRLGLLTRTSSSTPTEPSGAPSATTPPSTGIPSPQGAAPATATAKSTETPPNPPRGPDTFPKGVT